MRDERRWVRRLPRSSAWVAVAAVLLGCIAVVAPVQLPVVLHKAALVALAAVLGYWLDRGLFPYARPDGYLLDDWRLGVAVCGEGYLVHHPVADGYAHVYCAAMLRRAVLVAAAVLGMALGL